MSWTEDDDKELWALLSDFPLTPGGFIASGAAANAAVSAAAERLQRTEGAVRSRVEHLRDPSHAAFARRTTGAQYASPAAAAPAAGSKRAREADVIDLSRDESPARAKSPEQPTHQPRTSASFFPAPPMQQPRTSASFFPPPHMRPSPPPSSSSFSATSVLVPVAVAVSPSPSHPPPLFRPAEAAPPLPSSYS